MPYCHYAPIPLAKGSIIEAGNWGRLIKLNSASPDYIIEFIYEIMRRNYNASAPSRMNCRFVSPSLQAAEEFKCPLDILYEVELVNKNVPMHKTQWELFGAASAGDFRTLEAKICSYWTFDQGRSDCSEILISGAIRILGKVDTA